MAGLSGTEVAATLPGWATTLVEPGSADAVRLPGQWRAVLEDDDPARRRDAARTLWNPDLLALLPRFADALTTRVVDVRTCLVDDLPALVYVASADDGSHVSWIGFDPRSSPAAPPLWDSAPAPLRRFVRDVHAGFTSYTGESFGVVRPVDMATLADLADEPDGIPGWEEGADISSTRLLRFTRDSGALHYCASPDLPPGQIALVYEGDVEGVDAGPELDRLLMSRFLYPA
ncbi:hypothetical protein [Cellulomonas shaoxiangyii]|uniref:SMI1/KNR4 family protein n=1 Tax=Cellulomonas shaoxiangyii TaxID=2566013 RepID=A0A4P7SKP0_9CELL|nr:hypothetical protein [Cellulomonas shaoxiangyii]QCB94772.1 hypothetical protein E5225_15620 [Cellulomonas shaoxiangyii]TGY86502.1 hypothetical protein E5226_01645 [Cellulomonas shaoxiangyii]